ncbi:MAG TPA: GNAT family N-acetyltransferase [Candidatus Binatia bacterium]
MIRVRVLEPGDEPTIEAFLARHADASLFLRSNLRAGGLVDRSEPFQATWAGAFEGAELVAVAAHAWNGSVVVQAPRALADVVRFAVASSGRPLGGIVGEWDQVLAAREALGVTERPAICTSHDDLFALDLAELVVPSSLARGELRVRVAREDDRALVVRWRSAYRVELLGHPADDPELDASSAAEIEPLLRQESCFLLERDGDPVAFSAFNARLPDCVQIGGVFTPPALRGRGYARAVVAGSLLHARAAGATRSVLFTGKENAAARRAYHALGYRVVGEYGLVLF